MGTNQHPDFSMTTLEAAQANTLASITAQLPGLNENLKSSYMTAFNNWAQSVIIGRTPNTGYPLPPMAYAVGYFVDPTSTLVSGDILWAYPKQGADPVCALPPIPDVPKPYVAPVLPEPENIRNVPPGDTMPVGFVLTTAEGKRWQKQATPTPFGMAFYYARVA
jgi:hypothetical protein